MKATKLLHNLGQSLWLDNITRDLLDSGTLKRYIEELSVTVPARGRSVCYGPARGSRIRWPQTFCT